LHETQHKKVMDYAELVLFADLARTLHFGETSRNCHLSPSALSRAIQRLEAELGQRLFARDQRSVELTPEGELFRRYASDTLARLDGLKEEFSRGGERIVGKISIFASVTACQSFLPRILATFRKTHPDIHIQLETGYAANALEMLDREAVDVAVAALPDRIPPALVARAIVHTPLVFVAPALDCPAHQLLERRPIPWSEIPMVLPASGLARAAAERWYKRRRATPNLYSEVPGNEAILSLVALGCGLGIVPRLVVDKSPLRTDVRVLDLGSELGEFRVGICTSRQSHRKPIVRAFWDSLEPAA
jgi:LysR family positive regulator for ilvC